MGRKATAAETEYRVTAVLKMLASGVQRPAIQRYCADNWGLKSRAVDELLRKAKLAIRDAVDEDRQEFVARKLFQLEEIVYRASKRENHSAVIGAIKVQCELARVLDK